MVAVRSRGHTAWERLPARRTRRDALPEHTQYADTGCDLHPSCLTCPLVRCRYDQDVDAARKRAGRERDRRIIELQRRGKTIGMIAARFGVSRRTVFRVLARDRQRMADLTPCPSPLRPGSGQACEQRGEAARE
jgi:hypothetical protein